MPVETVLPGHGEVFGDHAALIDERFAMHERRAAKMLELIAEQPRSAHDIAQAIWGNVAVTQAFLTLSEVLGHVDLLLERGAGGRASRSAASCTSRRRSLGRSRDHPRRAAVSRWRCCRPPRARSTCRTRSCSWSAARSWALAPIGLPEAELDPDLVLVIFLPPLLYSGAFFANLRDLRADLRVDLAALDRARAGHDGVVAVVAHEMIDGLSWPAAFALGAIVGPTDPVAATAIASRLGVPRRLVSILEGEALINDATALVAYRIAITRRRLLAARRELRLPVDGGGRDRGRAGRRLGDRAGPQAAAGPARREHDRAAERLRGLRPGREAAPVGRARRGHRRLLRRLAGAEDRLAHDAPTGLRDVGAARVPAQRVPVHAGRAAAPGGARGLRARVARLRARGLRRRRADAAGLAARARVRDSRDRPPRVPARAARQLAGAHDRRLGGDARRGLARRGARAAPATSTSATS